jgi:predicted PurR-regulated permease PerM
MDEPISHKDHTSMPVQKEGPAPPWSIFTRYFVLTLIVAAVIWLAVIMAPMLQAIGIGLLLALLLNPFVSWLIRHRHWQRPIAAGLVFALFLLILLSVPIIVGSLAFNQMSHISADLFAAIGELEEWLLQPIDFLSFHMEPATMLANMQDSINPTLATLPLGSLNLLSSITTNLLWIITVFVMLFYFLKDGPQIESWFLDHLPATYHEEFTILYNRTEEIWGRFLRIQLLLFLVLAILMTLGTLLVVWLFRSGLIRWSPIGFVLLLLTVYAAVQQVDNLWLRPQYMGRHLQLHPAIVFISLIAGLAFGGILGALVSVPLVATARIIGKYLYHKIMDLPLPQPPSPPPSDSTQQKNN